MKIKFLLVCLLATTLFNGCKKDDEPTTNPPAATKTEMLTGKNWKLTANTVNPGIDLFGTGVLITDLMPTMQPCALDNLTNYSTSNTYTVDEGPTKCTGGAPQTFETGTWAFASSESQVIKTKTGGAAVTYTLVTLNATTLQLSTTTNIVGTNYVYLETYTKQ